MISSTRGILGTVAVLVATSGCSVFMGKPKAPFDTMKDSSVLAFRLDPYEAPVVPAAGTAQPVQSVLPPNLQQLLQQGVQGLSAIIPPGLIPPGLLQQGGTTAPTGTTPVVDNAPRFPEMQPNYRIISQTQLIDPKTKKELARVLGRKKNFTTNQASCLLPELGVRWSVPPAPAYDVLISFSCNQVAARNFIWPHPAVGMKPETVKDLSKVVNKIFPTGT
jgi:hypothetical protein